MEITIYRLDVNGKLDLVDVLLGVYTTVLQHKHVEDWIAEHHPSLRDDDLVLAIEQGTGKPVGTWRVDERREIEVTRLA